MEVREGNRRGQLMASERALLRWARGASRHRCVSRELRAILSAVRQQIVSSRGRSLVVLAVVTFGLLSAAESAGAQGFITRRASGGRGDHILISRNPCLSLQIRRYVGAAYGYPARDVRCVSDGTNGWIQGEWYIGAGGDTESGPGGPDDCVITIVEPDIRDGESEWVHDLGFLATQPNAVRKGPLTSGLPSLWIDNWEIVTPYGKTTDVVVAMYPSSSTSTQPRGAELSASGIAAAYEQAMYRH